MRPLAERALSRVTALAAVVLVAGCSAITDVQGDFFAPILIAGRVTDANRLPIPSAGLRLIVADDSSINAPAMLDTVFTANRDGSFRIHLAPNVDLEGYAASHGGIVRFSLAVIDGTDVVMQPLLFRRRLAGGTWLDDFLIVELRPLPVT